MRNWWVTNKVQFAKIVNLSNKQKVIYKTLSVCTHYSHILDFFNVNNTDVNSYKFNINQIRSNNIVLEKVDNWKEFLFKETWLIKSHKPSINTVLKTLKELSCFNLIPATLYKYFLTLFELFLIVLLSFFQHVNDFF